MFKFLSNDSLRVVKTAKRAGRRTMSKRQKVLNLLSKGESVSWKTLRNRFDLTSPRALVDTLRSEGAAERDALISELREDLEAASRRQLMERQNDEANFQQETINKVPLGIYIG